MSRIFKNGSHVHLIALLIPFEEEKIFNILLLEAENWHEGVNHFVIENISLIPEDYNSTVIFVADFTS